MINLKSEDEIIKFWEGDITIPKVSICCTAYNHETYIEDTLNGFLVQETNFPFEVLVHDDASTDNTQGIIKKYKEAYPNIIKPIYQLENQYSKGIRVNYTFNYSRAVGEYIALCEGDDYWVSSDKLQSQVNVMESLGETMLVTHATGVLSVSTGKIESNKIRLSNTNRTIDANEVILGGGDFGHTSSFLFRRKMIDNPPTWYIDYPSGDTPLRLLSAFLGTVYYIDKEMSIYRKGIDGSWTDRMQNNVKFINHWKKSIEMFNDYDKYTDYKYTNAIHKRNSRIAYSILNRLVPSENNKNMIKEYYSRIIGMDKMKYLLKQKTPFLFRLLSSIKR